jgi:hypothetical protein
MKQLLLFSFVLFFINGFSQSPVQLHLKKNGAVKKRIEPGSVLVIQTKAGDIYKGALTGFKKDSIRLSYVTVGLNEIASIKLPRTKAKMKVDLEQFAWVSLGVGLTTAGLVLADWKEFPGALGIAATIGYSPYVFQLLKSISLKKHRFKIGKRYTLRIWDIR